jgi:hypothetical protein
MLLSERLLASVSQNFISDGSSSGLVAISSTSGFKVKSKISIVSNTAPSINLEVKRVIDSTHLLVGPIGAINLRTDISAYTVIASAQIVSGEQQRPDITPIDRDRYTYDEEPTLARRSVLVDEFGKYYTEDNPTPVIVGDGEDLLNINPDGSINVNVVTGSSSSAKSLYNEISSVAIASLSNILTYTVPVGKTATIKKISVSGTNVADYQIFVNSSIVDRRRTYFGNLNEYFYIDNSISLSASDVLYVKVIHERPDVGDFNARLEITEL